MPERQSAALGDAAIGLAGALSLAVAMGIGRFSFTPMLPLMIADGQLDVSGGGWIAAANYLGYLLGALSAWRLGLSPTRLALTALSLTAVLTAAMALPLSTAGWALLRFVAGMASAWTFVATSTWCLQALARRGAAAWSSTLYAGVGSGIALAGLYCLVGASAGQGASSLWVQLAVLAALLVVPVWRVVGRMDEPRPAAGAAGAGPSAPSAATPASPGATAVLPPGSAVLVVSYGLFGFGYILPATFLPVMARQLVSDPRLFGLAWPAFGLMAAASTLVASWWLRRASRLRVWAWTQGAMGLGVLLPSLWLSGWTIAASALLVGGTFMVATLAGVQEMRERAGAGAPRALARMTTAFALGQIAGPLASNALLRVPGLDAATALDLALQMGAACLLATALWLWRAGRAQGTGSAQIFNS